MNSIRFARNASAAAVAGIAAWSSYHHMVSVALGVGERAEVAYALPLSVDGMLVVASVAMVDDRRAGRSVRWSARVAFAAGVAASVGANVAAAAPTIGARIVAAWPAVALLLTVELLSRHGRSKRTDVVDESPATSQVGMPVHVEVLPAAVTARPARRRRPAKAPRRPVEQTRALAERIAQEHPDMPRADVAARLGITDARLRAVLAETRAEATT